MNDEELSQTIDELSNQADALASITDMAKLRLEYEQWYSRVKKIVSDRIPEREKGLDVAYAYISHYLIEHLDYPGIGSRRIFLTRLQQQKGILLSALSVGPTEGVIDSTKSPSSSKEIVEHIFQRIHVIAKQLLERHEDRPTLVINDEYDVQDLLHALLRLHFDDIRPEEWTPSYAGKSSRIDFLLKDEQIVIEVKKTRKSLTDKEIGEQLIIDIERYRKHPSCKTLFCLVYDPEELISNPQGLERDLERQEDNFIVKVVVVPRRT